MQRLSTGLLVLAAAMSFANRATAGEEDDIKACAAAFQAATGERLVEAAPVWEPKLFSPSRVEFPFSGVECDIGLRGVVNLTQGATVYIRDGWPVGHREYFIEIEEKIDSQIAEFRAAMDKLRTLKSESEAKLRSLETNPVQRRDISLGAIEDITASLVRASDRPNDRARELAEFQLKLERCEREKQKLAAEPEACPVNGSVPRLVSDAGNPVEQSDTMRESNLTRIEEAISRLEFAEAHSLLEASLNSGELSDATIEALEDLTLPLVRPIPAREIEKNRDGYALLSALRPDEAVYQQKLRQYETSLLERQIERLADICRALMLFNGADVERNMIVVTPDPDVQNPSRWENVFLVEYRRRSDGTSWRYLCGMDNERITWSEVSEHGQPGRMWLNPSADHPRITYRLADDSVVFTEQWGGATRERELPL